MKDFETFDAIVIGSGFGGAVTACRLAEAGLKVCILERGRRYASSDLPVLPEETFWTPTQDQPDERKVPDFMRAFWKLGQGLWDFRDLGELLVGQAAGFGGGSLIYANVHLRAPAKVFEQWPAPYDHKTLQKYYDLAANILDVQQAPLDLPKTVALEAVAKKLPNQFPRSFRPPLAVNFEPEKKNRFGVDQGSCDMRGECCFGCKKQAKNTLDLNYLAAAEEQGAEVRTMAEVFAVELTSRTPRYEVRYRNHLKRGKEESIGAKYVFLCAGAVNTTELLLRGRKEGQLPVRGKGLGTKFFPNVDELAVVFDCDEEQETNRGPTITSSLLYERDETWLMIQDGGLPAHLEPLLGMFRSPLWLQRNAFAKRTDTRDDLPQPESAGQKRPHVALSQRVGYAELPVDSIVDILTGLTGSAIGSNLPLAHDVSRSFFTLVRGGRNMEQLARPDNPAREWSLCPEQLHSAMQGVRDNLLADLAIASEPMVETFIQRTAASMPNGLVESVSQLAGNFDIGNRSEAELREWALQVAIQEIWGSEAGLLGAIANLLSPLLAPEPKEILHRVSSVLRWALDYRAGDGHTAVLLTFGRDSHPASLELVADEILVGGRISGAKASGILVRDLKEAFVVTDVTGDFEEGELLFAGTRPVGICRSAKLGELLVSSGVGADSKDLEESARSASLRVLFVGPVEVAKDPRRFRTDSYRQGKREEARRHCKTDAPLRARLPPAEQTTERGTQELLLRDVAQALGGELRTDPLWPFLGRRVTVHSQGGCPMAEDEESGVTKPSGEVFGCDGLFVMDAAAFPSSVGANPSATIAAVAESKIEHFLREEIGKKNWTAKETTDAVAWAEQNRHTLDPINVPRKDSPQTSAPPDHKPIGIKFMEVMTGTHRLWAGEGVADLGPECMIETDLEAWIDDLATFLAADRADAPRELYVSGTVRIGWESGAEIKAYKVGEGSRIRLLSATDECGKETRSIEYLLEFEAENQGYVLNGIKDIRDDARFDIWEDTTTLSFLLTRTGEKEAQRCGVLRLPAAAFFGGQLLSFEATHTGDDPARQIWALSSFARFFFGHLVDVYVPALERVTDVGKRILGRGHV